jgi:hypothetical protein
MNKKSKAANFFAALAGLLLLAGTANANLITNPGFDVDDASTADVFGATGWSAFGGGTFTVNPANGGNSPVANSLDNSFKTFSVSGASQSFAATVGETYVASAVGQNFSGDPLLNVSSILIQIAYFDAGGLPAGTAAGGNTAPGFNLFDSNVIDAMSPQDVWTALGVGTAPAPDNTAEVRMIVLALAGSGGAGFFDDASLELAPVPVPAAVWLFGSALGLLGFVRRRMTT